MARLFDGSNDTLDNANAIVSTTPFTMACWFKTVGTPAGDQGLMRLYDSGVNGANYHQLYVDAGLRVRAATADASVFNQVNASAFFTAGAWQHACGVWASASSRRAFLNGADGQTNSTSRTPAALNSFAIGAFVDTVPSLYFNGDIMEAAIWNVALTDGEVAWLGGAAALCPLRVRPSALVAYWPMLQGASPEPDRVGGFDLTVNGPAASDHGRIHRGAPLSNPGLHGSLVVTPGGGGRKVFAIPG